MRRNRMLRRDFNLRALCLGMLGALSLRSGQAQPSATAQLQTTPTHTRTVAGAVPAATLLVLGDSLSAEYGLARGKGWVALLTDKLQTERPTLRVVNASISGETTAGGRSRLPALLTQLHPALVVIELGANDALRGLDLDGTHHNLEAMIQACQAAKARVVLVGMQVPPNYGAAYSAKFSELFANLAKKYRTGYVPFFLKGVADVPNAQQLFQADRIHPTEQAHPRMLANVWPEIKKNL